MAAPTRGRRTSTQGHPGRSLVLILVALVALAGGMFASGDTTPRLGIDLAGGTSITLKAKNTPGQKNAINKTNMNTAVDIIDRRVNGLGVSEAQVQTQGSDNIIVNIPRGTNSAQARKQVGTTAQLFFRPVLSDAAGGPTPKQSASPSGSPSSSASPSSGTSKSPSAGKSGSQMTSSSSPSSSSSPQGRALSKALQAGSASSGTSGSSSGGKTSSAKSSASASPKPSSSSSSSADAEAAALQSKLSKLNCNDATARAKAAEDAAISSKPAVACGKDTGVWTKYILGPAAVAGTDVSKAQATYDTQNASGWMVQMQFTGKGTKKFADVTGQLVNKQTPQNQFAIVLDGEVVSAPRVQEAMTGGNAQITGNFTQTEAQDLANMLSYGALPLSFHEQDVTSVGPELAGEQLRGGLIAGAVGLALVVAYLLFYYRGLSLVSIASLVVSAGLTYTIMSLLGPTIGFALNLPAVCGAIVAIGITADSFIVFFERIRDGIREGRTLRPAVERAWPRARRTILVSDFVSFLAAAVLYIVTVGTVQGFAFTLGLTTLLDVVVVFFFTKPLMTLLARRPFFSSGHPWSGLDPKRLGVEPPLRRARRTHAPVDPKEA